MTQDYKTRFKDEFGTHFSKSELQFALTFLDEVAEEARQEERERIVEWATERKTKVKWIETTVKTAFNQDPAIAFKHGVNVVCGEIIAHLSDK